MSTGCGNGNTSQVPRKGNKFFDNSPELGNRNHNQMSRLLHRWTHVYLPGYHPASNTMMRKVYKTAIDEDCKRAKEIVARVDAHSQKTANKSYTLSRPKMDAIAGRAQVHALMGGTVAWPTDPDDLALSSISDVRKRFRHKNKTFFNLRKAPVLAKRKKAKRELTKTEKRAAKKARRAVIKEILRDARKDAKRLTAAIRAESGPQSELEPPVKRMKVEPILIDDTDDRVAGVSSSSSGAPRAPRDSPQSTLLAVVVPQSEVGVQAPAAKRRTESKTQVRVMALKVKYKGAGAKGGAEKQHRFNVCGRLVKIGFGAASERAGVRATGPQGVRASKAHIISASKHWASRLRGLRAAGHQGLRASGPQCRSRASHQGFRTSRM